MYIYILQIIFYIEDFEWTELKSNMEPGDPQKIL